ncbi:dihydrofolate reductase family protein [Rhodovulum sulfidophilum]|nr:dihydrofolate reductase family protein [Rhodovulum sulfidophilum]
MAGRSRWPVGWQSPPARAERAIEGRHAGDLPEELGSKVRVTDLSPTEAMRMLQSEGHRRVYVDGGRVIQSFLRAGLIADMVITTVPVLLGEGRRLFGSLAGEIRLQHEKTKSYPSGLVQSRYRIAA